jgi:hypothetical protein
MIKNNRYLESSFANGLQGPSPFKFDFLVKKSYIYVNINLFNFAFFLHEGQLINILNMVS